MDTTFAKGKVARHVGKLPHFAEVDLSLSNHARTLELELRCDGAGWERQGHMEDVPPIGYDGWKAGASIGVRFALAAVGVHTARVTIVRISGMHTDTNPSIVTLAAALATWSALQVAPPADALARLEEHAFSSWSRDTSYVPTLDDLARSP